MKILNVFHQHALDSGRFAKVAQIEVNDLADPADVLACLDRAWRLTQNIAGSWSRGPTFEDGAPNPDHSAAIEVCAELPVHNGKTYGLRSSMVGDVFEIGGQCFKVANIGFELLGEEQAAQVAA